MPRDRIPETTKDFMVGVATVTWLLSLIPFVDWIMDPLQWVIFWLWFKTRGASLSKDWKMNLASGAISLIPTVGAILSAFPIVIYRNIRRVRNEDAEYNKSLGI